ncbi:MAG: hypothetical protein GY845_30360 [Planctomycetes bacterium]|nr:hypothetical protein [Planctomycetota bacterium]
MQTVKLPISFGANIAIDEIGLSTHGAVMVDGEADKLGNVHRRPGLELFADVETDRPVTELYWWGGQKVLVAASKYLYETTLMGTTWKFYTVRVYTIAYNGVATYRGSMPITGKKVKFADWGSTLYFTNGSGIYYLTSTFTYSALSDVDIPSNPTHLAILDKYLICNDADTGEFHYSVVTDPTTWNYEWDEAESQPDNAVAIGVKNLRLYLMGARTLELWRDDGSTPFVREFQGYVDSGTIAPYSFIHALDSFIWLDHHRNLVKLQGVTPAIISETLNRYIQSFETVEDAHADYSMIGGQPYYILTFPSEDKTIAVNLATGYWAEWCHWDGEYQRWLGNCVVHAPEWGKVFAGDRKTGKIYTLDSKHFDDNGNIIRTMFRTGHIDHGDSSKRKRSSKLVFEFKRTEDVTTASDPRILVKWRDDGETEWKTPRVLTLDPVGRTKFKASEKRIGRYYNRQYEVALLDSTPLELMSIQETFEFTR